MENHDSEGEVLKSLPFGKYKGKPVSTVPTGYLSWVLQNVPLRKNVEELIRLELSARGDGDLASSLKGKLQQLEDRLTVLEDNIQERLARLEQAAFGQQQEEIPF